MVSLRVRGPSGVQLEVPAVIDTGFSDWLTLSSDAIQYLALTFREEAGYLLADRTQAFSRLFVAEIEWLGRWRRVLVLQMSGERCSA